MKKLTQQEAEHLPEGSKVRITWSGGNGPHNYVIHIDKWGNPQIFYQPDNPHWFSRVDSVRNAFIGLEKPFTILEVEE